MKTGRTPAIAIKGLSKRYSKSDSFALKRLSLKVMPGEVYGFLGPNGAGKSTAIRTLLNFIQPTGGSASILGHDIVTDSVFVKQSIGYLSGDVALYPKMTGKQLLDYLAALQPLPPHPSYRKELCEQFQFDEHKFIHTLSKGNRQKLGLIQALMHEPAVLILDEPTNGLDPIMQALFFELIRNAKERGAAVFVSSHDLSEIQKMCDRIGFIRDGKLIVEQTIGSLRTTAAQIYDITFEQDVPRVELMKIPRAKVTINSSRHVTIQKRGDLGRMFQVLAQHKILSVDRRALNLEEEFLHLYKEGRKK